MADHDVARVFSIPDFRPDVWKTAEWLDLSHTGHSKFFKLDLEAAEETQLSSFDEILETSEEFFGIPPVLEPLKLSTREHNLDDGSTKDSRKRRWEDIDPFDGSLIEDVDQPVSTAEYKGWDGFIMPVIPALKPVFSTAVGTDTYSTAFNPTSISIAHKNDGHDGIATHPYIAALLALAMGRTSIFFAWSEKHGSFVQDMDRIHNSGISINIPESLHTRCLQCGDMTRFLHVFVQITYQTHPSVGRVAFAKAIDTVLLIIQDKLGSKARETRSLLQLQTLVHPVHNILNHFNSLVKKLNKARTDEQMLSSLFAEVRITEDEEDLLSNIMKEVLARVSKPWLEFVQKWIGVKSEDGCPISKEGTGKYFVKVEVVACVDDSGAENGEPDYVLDERRIPTFVPEDVTRTMFEAGKTLRLLRTHHGEHPLCHVAIIRSMKPPALDWHYSWKSIEKLETRANKYEASLLQAIRYPDHKSNDDVPLQQNLSRPGDNLQLFGREGDQLAKEMIASINEFNKPLPKVESADRLSQLLHDRLFECTSSEDLANSDSLPPWSSLPLLSFAPLIEAQARLVNREYMKLLFSSHKLRDHIALQRDFQLLGNGVFCDRLSHALFDADLETAERQAGVARNGGVMGLRLGSRDTWPPASSELRLALMGVLTESYLPASRQVSWGKEQPALPGDLSFAVRDLSDEEIEKCMNPGSLEALDFLRLSYKAPAQLATILTPTILLKYDKTFKLLLRILRMLYVTGELHRDVNMRTSKWRDAGSAAFRFRIEAQHFISSITTYFFDTGIGAPWRRFETWLDKVQSDLEDNNLADSRSAVVSPDIVREQHEQVLDSIMHTLLLKKRQQAVLQVLEDIFTQILKFSKLARLEALGISENGDAASTTKSLYQVFRKKVDVFITVCRGMSEKARIATDPTSNEDTNDDWKSGVREDNTIDMLLLQLEMSGYYGGTSYEHIEMSDTPNESLESE